MASGPCSKGPCLVLGKVYECGSVQVPVLVLPEFVKRLRAFQMRVLRVTRSGVF